MSKLIERVTVLRRDGGDPEPVTVYRRADKARKGSFLLRPVERAARSLVRAQVVFGQEILKRGERASAKRRDGWLIEAPANIAKSARKAYNEGRKGVPFKILPKA